MEQELLYGLLAGIGSIIAFGTYPVPFRFKRVVEADVNPMVFHLYGATIVGIFSLFVLSYVEFIWSWWGVLGALMWVIAQPLFYVSVQHIGITLTPPIVCGTTIVVSFIWGVTYFQESLRSVGMSVFAILLIIFSIFGVTFSKSEALENFFLKHSARYRAIRQTAPASSNIISPEESRANTDLESDGSDELNETERAQREEKINSINSTDVQQTEEDSQDKKKPKTSFFFGVGISVFVGILNGSLMVPFSMFVREQREIGRENVDISYLATFALGVLITITPVFITYFLIKRQEPVMHIMVAFPPSILVGVLWALGNYGALYATLYLGQAVGYPITQTNIVVAGMWGIFYFKEMKGIAILFFALFSLTLLGGVGLLTYFGSA